MKIFVMDLDGTQIDPTKSSLNERNIILNHLPAANAEDLISEAEEYTLSHPLEFSWTRARSLVCDLQELYRYLVDDFVIGFCQGLKERDFTVKSESMSRKRKGKREYLNDAETRRMMKELEGYFESKVEIPLMRHGKRQRLETLINEDALLLAKYLRNERYVWTPRISMI